MTRAVPSSIARIEPARAVAVLAAASVPSLVLGPAAIAVFVAPAVVIAVLSSLRSAILPAFGRTARDPLGLLLLVAFACWIPSLIVSVDPLLSLDAWSRSLAFVAMGIVLWAALGGHPAIARVGPRVTVAATAAAVGIALAALYGASEILSLVRFQGWQPRDAALGLKAFANAGMLLVPAVLWGGWRLGGGWRLVAIAAAVGLILVIDATSSRAALAGVLASAFLAGVLLAVRVRKPVVVAAIALGLVVFVAVGILFLLEHSRDTLATDFEPFLPIWLVDVHRQVVWTFTWDQAWSAPIFGVGLNALDRVEGAFAIIPGLDTHYLPSHPHNWLLEVFAETGIVGALPFFAFVAAAMTALVRDYLRFGHAESLATAAFGAGYWVSGCFNFSLWAAWWQLAHIVLAAVILAARPTAAVPDAPRGGRRTHQ